jgi:hypothetical protein
MMADVNAPRTSSGPAFLLTLLLAGCPGDPSGKTGEGNAPVDSSTTAAPASGTTAGPQDPLAGSVFTREEVLEIFRAEHVAGADPTPANEAERKRLLVKHRLVDEEGREVIARMRAYDRAVQALAEDTEAWATFVESLPR